LTSGDIKTSHVGGKEDRRSSPTGDPDAIFSAGTHPKIRKTLEDWKKEDSTWGILNREFWGFFNRHKLGNFQLPFTLDHYPQRVGCGTDSDLAFDRTITRSEA
jgi:hypothetical protein